MNTLSLVLESPIRSMLFEARLSIIFDKEWEPFMIHLPTKKVFTGRDHIEVFDQVLRAHKSDKEELVDDYTDEKYNLVIKGYKKKVGNDLKVQMYSLDKFSNSTYKTLKSLLGLKDKDINDINISY